MGNNCIGYFIERFQCFGEIVDLPNFNQIWIDFQSNSGNQARCSRRRIGWGEVIGLLGVCLPKDQTSNQTGNCLTLLPEGCPPQSLPAKGCFYHQRDRPWQDPLNILINMAQIVA